MQLKEKIYCAIAAGWLGALIGYVYYAGIKARDNNAAVEFSGNVQEENQEFITRDPCQVTLRAYGNDIDSIRHFELRIDEVTYLSKTLEGFTEYSFTTELCGLGLGRHKLETIVIDSNGNEQREEKELMVRPPLEYI